MSWLRIGTCSWKYNSWRGLIYPNKKSLNHLKEYAKVYDMVEVDQWFWSLFGNAKINLPLPRVVHEYKLSVPEEFIFTIKMPNSLTLTHFYRKVTGEPLQVNPYFFSIKLLNQFLATIEPLKNQMGSLMYQFEYLNKQKMASQYEFQKKFEEFLKNSPAEYPYAIEIRNPNYLNKRFFNFLNQNNLQFVFLQGYYMPSILDIYNKFRDQILGTTVIRLHGGDRQEIEEKSGGQWGRILEPKDRELEQVVDMVRDLLAREVNVFLNVNNHYEGSAPITIRKLREIMGQTGF